MPCATCTPSHSSAIGHDLHRVTEQLNEVMAGFSFQRSIAPATRGSGEKRRHPRLERGVLVTVSEAGAPDIAAEALASDISVSGMQLVLPHALKGDGPITVGLQLPADSLDRYMNQPPLKLQAVVRWQRQQDGQPHCGLEFRDLTAAQRDRIAAIFAFYNQTPVYGG
jgi:hypothetical protein